MVYGHPLVPNSPVILGSTQQRPQETRVTIKKINTKKPHHHHQEKPQLAPRLPETNKWKAALWLTVLTLQQVAPISLYTSDYPQSTTAIHATCRRALGR